MITLLAVTLIIFFVLNGRFSEKKIGEELISKELEAQAEKYRLSTDITLIRTHWGLILDRSRSQLLYLTFKAKNPESKLLDLHKVVGCTILKSYSRPGSLFSVRNASQKEYIDGITLSIKHNGEHYKIPFFRYGTDKLSEMKMMSRQARHWQRLIQQ